MSEYAEGFAAGIIAILLFNLAMNAAIFVMWLNHNDRKDQPSDR